jgi:hypothetical protein
MKYWNFTPILALIASLFAYPLIANQAAGSMVLLEDRDLNLMAMLDGYEVLNGGDVVVCRNQLGEILSVELLDVMESRLFLDRFPLELGNSSWTATEKARFALNRLMPLDPERATRYLQQLVDFFDSVMFLEKVSLVDVPDSHHLAIPKNCDLEQVAIQISNIMLPEPARIIINKDLWDLLDADNQAALILHEIIYQEAFLLGHTTSFRVRYFNNFICSNKPNELDLSRYVRTIIGPLGFPNKN